jgi:hypothetical protein
MLDVINVLIIQLILICDKTAVELIVIILPWILSGLTLWTTFMAGNNNPKTWLISLFGQVLWSIWIVLSKNWGLIPLNIGLWILYYRNHKIWNGNN